MTTTYPYAIPANLDQWAQDVEALGGYPASDTPALIAWGQAEGGSFNNPDYGNVLGTTLPEPGSAPTNSAGVQNYAASGQSQAQAWAEGLAATISMFHQSNMKDINAALASGNPAALPPALNADPWGTSGSSVASILGESPQAIAAIGAAGGSGSGGGTGTLASDAQLAKLNANPFDLFGIPQTVGGSVAGAVWSEVGPFLAKAFLVIGGIGLVVLGLYKATDAGPKIKAAANDAGPAAALAAA